MPTRMSLIVLYLISIPISDLLAFSNNDLIVFSPLWLQHVPAYLLCVEY